jgi:YidC/Oxa1 family membrane protein insertase
VVYWVTQSIYGIIQQWFITGWGKLNDYIPGLPQLPEHKRLGYKPPRDLDEIANVPPKEKGMFGRWWAKQMEQAQQISEERKATAKGGTGAGATATAAPAARKSTTTSKSERPYARNSPKGRMLAEQARREAAEESRQADITAEEADETDIAADGAITTPRRSRRAKK